MTDKLLPCPGADDPAERCPRHPNDCSCWKVDLEHPARQNREWGDDWTVADTEAARHVDDIRDRQAADCPGTERSARQQPHRSAGTGEETMTNPDTHNCPICDEPFKPEDVCASDIELGTCHAACLEGSSVVNLDTGEETGGEVDTYPYSEVMDPPAQDRDGAAHDAALEAAARRALEIEPLLENHFDLGDFQHIFEQALWAYNDAMRDTPDVNPRVQAPEDFEEKLSDFLEALDEWGCDDNVERAQEILEFQRTGYDLDAYLVEHPDRAKSELN